MNIFLYLKSFNTTVVELKKKKNTNMEVEIGIRVPPFTRHEGEIEITNWW